MSDFSAAAAKLLRGAIENISEDLLRDALDAEQIRTSASNVNQLGQILDEIDWDEAAGEAEQRLIAAEAADAREQRRLVREEDDEEPGHGYWEAGDYS